MIVRSRDRVVRNAYDWEAELLEMHVGEEATLRVRRGSRERSVKARVADLPEVSAQKVAVLKEIELLTLTPAIRPSGASAPGRARWSTRFPSGCPRSWASRPAT